MKRFLMTIMTPCPYARSRQAQVQFHRGTQYVTEKLRRVPNDHPSSKGNFQRMASILGDRAKAAAPRIPTTSLAAQVTIQNNNNNLTSGIKDPRAPFYDPCAETYTHRKFNLRMRLPDVCFTSMCIACRLS